MLDELLNAAGALPDREWGHRFGCPPERCHLKELPPQRQDWRHPVLQRPALREAPRQVVADSGPAAPLLRRVENRVQKADDDGAALQQREA